MLWLLFSFQGRIGRAQFWGANTAIGVGLIVVLAAVFSSSQELFLSAMANALYPDPGTTEDAFRKLKETLVQIGFVVGPLFVVCLWMMCALAVKRLHDRGRPAWWLAVYCIALLIPMIGLFAMIWYFVELGCLPASEDANRYDAEPAAADQAADAGRTADWAANLDMAALGNGSSTTLDYQPRVLKKRKSAVERVGSRPTTSFGRRGNSA